MLQYVASVAVAALPQQLAIISFQVPNIAEGILDTVVLKGESLPFCKLHHSFSPMVALMRIKTYHDS